MNEQTYTVLFLCKENAGRSLMAESMLNKLGHGKFKAYSAGIIPAEKPNPVAIQLLQREGFNTEHLTPKHYSVFLAGDVPHLDFVFTLCEDSAEEAKLNIWNDVSADTITAHWHFSDPHYPEKSESTNNDVDNEINDYSHIQRMIAQRIKLFMTLPDNKLDQLANHDD